MELTDQINRLESIEIKEEDKMPALSLNKTIYLVADQVLVPITISSSKMSLTLDGAEGTAFYLMILMAKSAGWSGGHDMVEEITNQNNEQFVLNKKINNCVHINSNEALELKEFFERLMNSGISIEDGLSTDDIFLEDIDLANRVIDVIGSGDITIKVG